MKKENTEVLKNLKTSLKFHLPLGMQAELNLVRGKECHKTSKGQSKPMNILQAVKE